MGDSYRELMERVEVTAEMRQRILDGLDQAEIQPHRRAVSARWALLAACVAIVVTVGLVQARKQPEPISPDAPSVMTVSPFAAVDSVEELERMVGFSVPELTGLPFSPESVSYQAMGTELAEVTYCGEGQTAVFRKSLGSEDISGDYRDYARSTELTLEGVSGVLKGGETGYTLACWHSDGAAYSLRLSAGMEESAWLELLTSLTE